MSALPMRPYQDECLAAIGREYLAGTRHQLVGLPTGAGKTCVFGTLAARAHAKSGWRCLIVAHRDELIEQAVDKLCMIRPDLVMAIGVVKASRNEWEKDIVVASVQSLHARRLAEIPADRFDLVIVDEAHHAAADTYRAVLDHFQAALYLGVTATPERADGKHLADVWEKVVYHRSILEMVAEGYLCDAKGIACHLEALDLDQVKRSRGDWQDGDLGEALEVAEAPRHAVATYLEHAAGRKAIVFTPTVALSQHMADAFCEAGVAAEHLDGTTPRDERRAILARLTSGETMVVSNCGVLTEGFDEPSVSCIIMARPTQSKVLYVQCVGRGLRLHPDKSSAGNRDAPLAPGCLVIDLMGNTRRHSLISVPRLISEGGLDEQIVGEMEDDGLSIVGAIERQAEAVRTGRLVAQMVDLFQTRGSNWQQVDAQTWTLGGAIVLRQGADYSWSVEVREGNGASRGPREVVAHGLTLEYAQGVGEDQARRMNLGKLVARDAAWRLRPASEKQRRALWALGERSLSRSVVTAGEASDALDVAIARKGL